MNKKLFALLLVSAFALQLKADGSGSATESAAPASSATAAAANAGGASDDDGVVIDGDTSDDDLDGDDGSGALGDGGSVSGSSRGSVGVRGRGGMQRFGHDGGAAAAAGAGAADVSGPTFVMPGNNEGTAKGVARRLLNKVWTSKVAAKDRAAILTHGAENFDTMNVAEKAHYFNAQDAQAGLWTYRGFKGVRALFVAGFVKLVRDVINETEDDDDEEDEVAAAV